MIRDMLFLAIVLATAASAIAAISPAQLTAFEANVQNVTVIEKNQAWPLAGPLIVEECDDDGCSLTRG